MATYDVDGDALLAKVGQGGSGMSAADKKILDAASRGLSPEEIAEEIGMGLTALRAGQRVREILKARDWLSVVERKMLLMDQVTDLREYINDQMQADKEGHTSIDGRGREIYIPSDPRWAQNMIALLKEVARIIEVDSKNLSDEVSTIRDAHAHLMVEAIDLAFQQLVFAIRKEYPDVQTTDLYRFVEAAMPKAIELVESRTA